MEDEKFEQELKNIMRSAAPKGAQEVGPKEPHISVQGSGNYVANGPIIFAPTKSSPSKLPAGSSRTCPQCGDVNWITKRYCKTCEMDLFAIASRAYHSRAIKRFLCFAAGSGALSLASIFVVSPLLKRFGLDTAGVIASFAGLAFGVLVALMLKEIGHHAAARSRL